MGLKRWRYNLSEDTYIIFTQCGESNAIEAFEAPYIMREDVIIRMTAKKALSDFATGQISRSYEIEFAVDFAPNDFRNELLMPSRTKKIRTVDGYEYDIYVTGGLMMYFYINGTLHFVGLHTENYFDVEIGLENFSLVVEFVEFWRVLAERFNSEVNRLIWQHKWYRDTIRGQGIPMMIDFRYHNEPFDVWIYRTDTDKLRAIMFEDLRSVVELVLEDIARSMQNRQISVTWGVPVPEFYKRIDNGDGVERRGNKLMDEEINFVVQQNEAPLWLISEDTKTLWDATQEWCISCPSIGSVQYSEDEHLNVSLGALSIDDLSTFDLPATFEPKKVRLRALNSDWTKVSFLARPERGIDLIERKSVSATGEVRSVNCFFNTVFEPVDIGQGGGRSFERLVAWANKFFYWEDGKLYRACDLQVSLFDWAYYVHGDRFLAGYREYVRTASYGAGLLDYYEKLLFHNKKACEVEVEGYIEWNELSKWDNKAIWVYLYDLVGRDWLSVLNRKGIALEYSYDFAEKRLRAKIILCRA